MKFIKFYFKLFRSVHKKILTFFFLYALINPGDTHATSDEWQFYNEITINASMTPNADQSDFPLLIYKSNDSYLASNAQADGDDLLFTLSDGETKLSHEIEKFDSSTGELAAWVKIPTLSHATNTVIHLYYGNAAAANQENINDVWSNNYLGVWHLDESPANGVAGHLNSTSNTLHASPYGFDGSADSTTDEAGRISGGDKFDGTDDLVEILNAVDGTVLDLKTSNFTTSIWVKMVNPQGVLFLLGNAGFGQVPGFRVIHIGGGILRFRIADPANADIVDSDDISDGAWHHFFFVKDSNSIDIYKNGTFLNSTTPLTVTDIDAVSPFHLGGRQGSWYINSSMDEFRVSNIDRDAHWIKASYNNQNDYFASSPQNYVSFSSQTSNQATSPNTFLANLTISPTQVSRGGILHGTVTITNQTDSAIKHTNIFLNFPPGLNFMTGSEQSPDATISSTTTQGKRTTIVISNLAASSSTVTFQMTVSQNVNPGDNLNISMHTEND